MPTFQFIAKAEATNATSASFDFTSIPQTYQDLVIIGSARNNVNNYGGFFIIPNSSTMSTNVNAIRLGFTGASQLNSTSKESVWNLSSDTTNYYAGFRIYITNYSSSSSNKQAYIQASQGGQNAGLVHHLTSWNWGLNQAISRIELRTDSGTDVFKQYSVAVLYGISKA